MTEDDIKTVLRLADDYADECSSPPGVGNRSAARAALEAYLRKSGAAQAAALSEARAEAATSARRQEVLRAERDHERAKVESAVRLLTGIHALLYPAPIKTPDGRTMVFRPKDPDPHQVLQELSDRIRALPDEIAAIAGEAP